MLPVSLFFWFLCFAHKISLDEKTIKTLFLKAYNLLMSNRESIAADCRTLADMLGDMTAIEFQLSACYIIL